MVRTTTTEEKAVAQWSASWMMLTPEWRAAISRFVSEADPDVGAAIMRV